MTCIFLESVGGVAEYLHWDESDDRFAVERRMDATPVLDANARRRNDGTNGYGKSRELRHLATVPIVVQYEWIRRYGADPLARGQEDLLRRVLNDPDWRWLRTSEGRA